jgi:DNA-binding GntR family transcriptional regulator
LEEVVTSPSTGLLGSSAEAVDAIRRAILAGEFGPGRRLVEAELSERFEISRGAARNALVDLAHEGLVERVANRGARVRAVSVREAIEITEVRMAVEGLCAAKAADHITDEEIVELRGLGEEMKAAVASGDFVTYSGLNQRLHERVRDISAQHVAAEVLSRLRARNVRHQFGLAMRPGRPQVSLPEHLAIIDEVCARSPGGAERAVRRHISSVLEALAATPADDEVT